MGGASILFRTDNCARPAVTGDTRGAPSPAEWKHLGNFTEKAEGSARHQTPNLKSTEWWWQCSRVWLCLGFTSTLQDSYSIASWTFCIPVAGRAVIGTGTKTTVSQEPCFPKPICTGILAYFSSKLLLKEVSTPLMEVWFHWGHPWNNSVQLPPYIFTSQTPQLHAITWVFNVAPTTVTFILKWFRKAEESKLICII